MGSTKFVGKGQGLRFQHLADWLDWQTGLNPRSIDLGLERVSDVWRRLRPQGLGCPVVTVAGTNGKGSVLALLEATLLAAGYRTGCYTSPHLIRYNERIRIDGRETADTAICAAFERVDQARGELRLTYFEFATLAALLLFADAGLDLALLEVGLGGRLDAVNVVDPDLALITTVDLDHTAWLGNTREQIALEKAGILRRRTPAVIGDGDPPATLVAAARALEVPLYVYGREFRAQPAPGGWRWEGPAGARNGLPLPRMPGEFQLRNAASVLMALELLAPRFPITQAAMRNGLRSMSLPGRFQVVSGTVPVILDVAHNPQAARGLAANLAGHPCPGRTLAVFGMLADKDVSGVTAELASLVDEWHLCALEGERGQDAAELIQRLHPRVRERPSFGYRSPEEALAGARDRAKPGDQILVFGSFHTVGAALKLLS